MMNKISCQMFSVGNFDILVCDDLDQKMFSSFSEYSIIISCQILNVVNGDISVCDDLDLDQMMFASFNEYNMLGPFVMS